MKPLPGSVQSPRSSNCSLTSPRPPHTLGGCRGMDSVVPGQPHKMSWPSFLPKAASDGVVLATCYSQATTGSPYVAGISRDTAQRSVGSLVNPLGLLSGDRQPRPGLLGASCSPTNSPEGVGAGDVSSTNASSTLSSTVGWPEDASIHRDIQCQSSAVSLSNPVTEELAGAHHPRPGDITANCSPSTSVRGEGAMEGLSIVAKQWSSRRSGKHAKDYFAASSPVWVEKDQPYVNIPRLTEPARPQPSWPIDAAFSPAVQSAIEVVVQSMMEIAGLVTQAEYTPKREEFLRLAQQAVSSENKIFNEEHALVWGEGFEWPAEARAKDLADFTACNFSLEELARRRIAAAQPRQLLTPQRVAATLHADNPHMAAVLDVANGVSVALPPGFVPNGTLQAAPPMSPAYRKLHSAVDKTYFDTHGAAQLAIVLPRPLAEQYIKDFHTSRLAWTTKPGKPGGRSLIDPTWAHPPFAALNSIEVRDACEARYGSIHNPTIEEVVFMVLQAQDMFPQQVIVLWLMDVKGAYTQLAFRADHVRLMAAVLFCGAVMFFVGGIFGWAGQPFAFDTVTRAIRWELQRAVKGKANIYVDDGMGATTRRHLDHDLSVAASVFTGLMGPEACAQDKTKAATSLNIIGYNLNTETGIVQIAEKNVLKALYGFMSATRDRPITFQLMERLAAWGSRYSMICPLLQPFTATLHSSMHRLTPRCLIAVTPLLWSVILLFRTMLALTALRSAAFARSFESFRPLRRPETCPVLTFDASLEGIGVLIYQWNRGSSTLHPLGGVSISIRELGFSGQPQFQNVAEFIGAYFAVRVAALLGCDMSYVWLAGDSISALTWAGKGGAHSAIATNTASLFALQAITLNMHIGDYSHIAGSNNWRCDLLSRAGSWNELVSRDPAWQAISPTILDPLLISEVLTLVDPRNAWLIDPKAWKLAQAATLRANSATTKR